MKRPTMARPLITYNNAQLYPSDLNLFTSFQWLNDNAINFYMTYIYHYVIQCCPDILLMDASVVSFMIQQCHEEEEEKELVEELQLTRKRIIFVPVNDNQSFQSESTHWSLLVIEVDKRTITYYDSNHDYNLNAAKRIVEKWKTLLKVPNFELHCAECPPQINGYDCGMYVLIITEYLCTKYCGLSIEGSLKDALTPEKITQLRLRIPTIVQKLLHSN